MATNPIKSPYSLIRQILTAYGPLAIVAIALGWYVVETDKTNRKTFEDTRLECKNRVESQRAVSEKRLKDQREATDQRLALYMEMSRKHRDLMMLHFRSSDEQHLNALIELSKTITAHELARQRSEIRCNDKVRNGVYEE